MSSSMVIGGKDDEGRDGNALPLIGWCVDISLVHSEQKLLHTDLFFSSL